MTFLCIKWKIHKYTITQIRKYTNTKCLKDTSCAIFFKSMGFKDIKYDIPVCQIHYIYITFTLHSHYIHTTFTLHSHYIYITFTYWRSVQSFFRTPFLEREVLILCFWTKNAFREFFKLRLWGGKSDEVHVELVEFASSLYDFSYHHYG